MQECSVYTGYNPVNGAPVHTIRFPSGENVEKGLYTDPIGMLKELLMKKLGARWLQSSFKSEVTTPMNLDAIIDNQV